MAGNNKPARMAMIAITTSSSIRVKPAWPRLARPGLGGENSWRFIIARVVVACFVELKYKLNLGPGERRSTVNPTVHSKAQLAATPPRAMSRFKRASGDSFGGDDVPAPSQTERITLPEAPAALPPTSGRTAESC